MDPGERGWVAFEIYREIDCILRVKSTKFGTVIVFDELINSSCGLIHKNFSRGTLLLYQGEGVGSICPLW